MSTTTRRAPRANQVAMPFSAAAQKLIRQLQAEAHEKLLSDLSAKDALIVLHGIDQQTKIVRSGGDCIEIHDAKGNFIDIVRRREEPESWRNAPCMAGKWHPAYWNCHKQFVDGNGSTWRKDSGTMVCNDFGDLVEVCK